MKGGGASSAAGPSGGGGGSSGDEPASTLKRPRLVWTPQLHRRFVDAVAHLGIENAVPKTITQLMNVDGLTRENVASHLRDYRLYLRMQGLRGGGAGGVGAGHLFATGPVHFLPPGHRAPAAAAADPYPPFAPMGHHPLAHYCSGSMVKGTHGGKMKHGAGAAASSGSGVAAEASTSSAAMAETSRTAVARRQPPRGVVRRWRQSALSVAVFLSKKGKLLRKKAGPSSFRRVCNASGLNRLGSVLADPCVQPHRFTLTELTEITHDFSDEQLLGEGAFGKVYKGVLQNGDTIAVKRLNLTMAVIQDNQYENEARHLMRLKHPNIVQLVGYCSETEKKFVLHDGIYVCADKFHRLLCLEYLPKGDLRGHLSDECSGLDWSTRYKIIEGICYGLHYLHEGWQVTPIIHMDLKPANIMLDGNMVPKIADFGLSRLFGEEQTRTCTSNRNGTLGYMAPEYRDKGIITKKLDIFSLGVIIIEIMTGRKDYPLDETETSSQQYIELVLNEWRHRPRKAPGYTSGDIDFQQIKRCIQIGLLCVKIDQAERPTIRQIIKMLDGTEGAEAECIDERKGLSRSQGSPGERRQSGGAEPLPNSPRSIQRKVADAQSPSTTSVHTGRPPSPGPPPPSETVAAVAPKTSSPPSTETTPFIASPHYKKKALDDVGMGRAPCRDRMSVKRGPWSPEEDEALRSYIMRCGTAGNWTTLPCKAGLKRLGNGCRLRWLNYLRPDIKHGGYTEQEDRIILSLYSSIGSRWSIIASKLPGRTGNDVRNYWNTKLNKVIAMHIAQQLQESGK